jgi:hypothetical protein
LFPFLFPFLFHFLFHFAVAEEIILRNDQALDDAFGGDDEVLFLEFPECAVTVLEAEPKDLPLEIDTVLVYLGSILGNQDREITMLTMAMEELGEGEDPRIMGYSEWDWPETAFWVTVSSEYFNALNLQDPDNGIYSYTMEGTRLAVFVCAPDPDWDDETWPCFEEGVDCSGIVVETASPSEGSWLSNSLGTHRLSDLGTEGAWVIRATGTNEHGDDTGLDDTGDLASNPALLSITPETALVGEAVDFLLQGEEFEPGMQVTIGSLVVTAPELVDDRNFRGRSPSSLPAGLHDVMVTNLDGGTATLDGAFLVTAHDEGDEHVDEGDEHVDEAKGGTPCGCGSAPTPFWLVFLAPAWLRRRNTLRTR